MPLNLAVPPTSGDYAPYFEKYVTKVPEGSILSHLESQHLATDQLLRSLPAEAASIRYEPGKWTLTESLGHVVDTERIFAYRALWIARGDKTPLPGFDQDVWVPNSGHAQRSVVSLLDEFALVRKANVELFRNLPEDGWDRRGTSNNHEVTPRAIAWMIAGHEIHHYLIFRDRYLASAANA
jgi:uncharacterized damage-inducible protein DinB